MDAALRFSSDRRLEAAGDRVQGKWESSRILETGVRGRTILGSILDAVKPFLVAGGSYLVAVAAVFALILSSSML